MSFNSDLLGIMLVFVFAVQLTVEVLVFGWDRAERFNQAVIWAEFFEQHNTTKTVFKWIGIVLSIMWLLALVTYPIEALIAAVFAVAMVCVSMYFTLFDNECTYIGAKF